MTLSKLYNLRPSQVVRARSSFEAFCIDEAIAYLATEEEKHEQGSSTLDWLKGLAGG